nr:hypothetical protein [Clostridioides sp.]
MDISKINKRVNNTPDNIKEELDSITNEYIKGLFNTAGDESNPLDYYTKFEIDNKIYEINAKIDSILNNTELEEKINLILDDLAQIKLDIKSNSANIASVSSNQNETMAGVEIVESEVRTIKSEISRIWDSILISV